MRKLVAVLVLFVLCWILGACNQAVFNGKTPTMPAQRSLPAATDPLANGSRIVFYDFSIKYPVNWKYTPLEKTENRPFLSIMNNATGSNLTMLWTGDTAVSKRDIDEKNVQGLLDIMIRQYQVQEGAEELEFMQFGTRAAVAVYYGSGPITEEDAYYAKVFIPMDTGTYILTLTANNAADYETMQAIMKTLKFK